MKTQSKLAILIPTKDRPQDLGDFLLSLEKQDIQPDQVIIIDGGDIPINNILEKFKNLNITYVKVFPPSLTTQRNTGLKLLNDDIEIVGFFDDDIVLYPKILGNILKIIEGNSDIGGVTCNNISHPRAKVSLLEKIFMLGSDVPGIVLKSGYQSKICSVDKDYQTKWVMGGATFWKRKVINEFKFDEWYAGYGFGEDLDYSYPVGKMYKLFVLKDAKCEHRTKPITLEYEYPLGKMQVINRVYFVKKHKELSLICCYWACFGLLLKNLFLGVFCFKRRYLLRAFGVFHGIFESFFKLPRITEKIKK